MPLSTLSPRPLGRVLSCFTGFELPTALLAVKVALTLVFLSYSEHLRNVQCTEVTSTGTWAVGEESRAVLVQSLSEYTEP